AQAAERHAPAAVPDRRWDGSRGDDAAALPLFGPPPPEDAVELDPPSSHDQGGARLFRRPRLRRDRDTGADAPHAGGRARLSRTEPGEPRALLRAAAVAAALQTATHGFGIR